LDEDHLATNVIMPALGVAQQTGTLLKWLKAEGQSISKGEPLMEVETDKATVEIEAPASGILSQVIAKVGDEVPVGQRIALILAPGETASEEKQSTVHTPVANAARSSMPPPATGPKMRSAYRVPPVGGRILASPAAKRIARENGVNLEEINGSGPEGSILMADVLPASLSEPSQGSAVAGAEEFAPLTPMRRIVAARMTQSKQTAPHFYLSMDVDMSAVGKLRGDLKNRGEGIIPSINDFILFACARALKAFPAMNSSYTESGIKIFADINIGMAVALDEGLVVPVIRHSDRLSLTELALQSRQVVDKAQNKKLLPLDCEDGTFTVSNLGMLGVDSFVAIINPPQCAILAVGRIVSRVVADDDMFAIAPLMTATLSADHRVVDGAIAARFLGEVKKQLESAAV
jgi:pyruvate dehydrogenase E2 component (dihydrolipoyllysine-residue acetyltransferase)